MLTDFDKFFCRKIVKTHEFCRKGGDSISEVKDLTGLQFGRLTVIRRAGSIKQRAAWLCRCECGVESVKVGKLLLNGHCRSCGCGERENRINNVTRDAHHLSNTRLYNIWCAMKQRCYYSENNEFHNYGGRGVEVCEEWRDDFLTFKMWSEQNGYKDNLSIDRIDVNGNYEPSNCKWSTSKEQARNRRETLYLTVNGETKSLIEWCEIVGLDYGTAYYRYYRGMSPEDVLRKKVI